MRLRNIYSIVSLLSVLSVSAAPFPATAGNIASSQDGITLSTTRVIYPGDARNGITYTLTNNTLHPFLLQSRVILRDTEKQQNSNDAEQTPFIVLPPLTRFEPDTALTLRIRLTKNTLHHDRESVFTLALNAIPAQQNSDETQTSLVMSTQNNLKLFYRPSGLPPADIEQIAKQIEFRRSNNELTVKNPTPFYITFNTLFIGNTEIELGNNRMMAPFSEQKWSLQPGVSGDIRWQLITDDGSAGKTTSRPLNSAR
ncbi:molecular chaperone [Morganella psychrotolerans]|uniref:fimbrial biogenesis chaperone n=1 Tax=Morganella psychrotolerans TaxID=368603 RepID=UPI0039B08270